MKMFGDQEEHEDSLHMGMPKLDREGNSGSWSIESESDPRWNKSGRGLVSVFDGKPKEVEDWIEECIRSYGPIPKDCTYSCMKD